MPTFDALPKHYDPSATESLYDDWEKNDYFSSAVRDGRDNFSIVLPPPNVTGTLHMGHAFQHTLMDALIRHQRMSGNNTLWQAGTDHAGIATQIVVTRQLEQRGIDAATLSREEFLRHAWEWKEHSGSTISRQMRRLGTSCDWTRERFTMDEGLSAAVTEAFVRLHEEGLIYRGKRLVNWDPVMLTAVSDLEVVSKEEDGVMYYVRYPFVEETAADGIVIGTTRPETILVDGAIAVHPDDERFRPLVGKRVWVPMTEPPRSIEIIADAHVDPDFGSGCVKITAAHDFNDYEVYTRHPDKNIPLIVLFTPEAVMNENAPKRYQGLERYVARDRIVEDLRAEGLLLRTEKHRYKLPRGERTGVVVEPMLTDQWFLRMDDMAAKGLQLTANGKLNFVPANWRKVYEQWLENIHDWCISRQLMWGHQIPAWYDEDGAVYVARDEAAAQRQAPGKTLRRDADVLDTWFSSALWPFSTLDWPHAANADTRYFKHYFPTSVLVTGFDIIFFWVARMAMFAEHFVGDTPFHDVYITGLVRDGEGQKMSKSRGNVLDPLDLVDGIALPALLEKRTGGLMNPKQAEQIRADTARQFPDGIPAYGVDALRFTFASLASYGRDIKFDLSRCEGYRHFCNKLWNASRFVLGVCGDTAADEGVDEDERLSGEQMMVCDDWIIGRLQHSAATVADSFRIYRFDLAATAMYQFFWDDYCDWYVEAAKVQLRRGDGEVRRRTRATLAAVLEAGLRLCHPIIPFVTEQLWRKIVPLTDAAAPPSIMLAPYPQAQPEKINDAAAAQMARLQEAVAAARQLRNAATGASPQLLVDGDEAAMMLPLLAALGGIRTVRLVAAADFPDDAATVNAGALNMALQCETDTAAMAQQWRTQLTKVQADLAAVQKTLANPQFMEKAPAAVADKKRRQADELQARQDDLLAKLGV